MLHALRTGLLWLLQPFVLARYRKRLGPHLANTYGRRETYSIDQIRQALIDLQLPASHLAYALALHCSLDDFERYNRVVGEHGDYVRMRSLALGNFRRVAHAQDGGGTAVFHGDCSDGGGHGAGGDGGSDGGCGDGGGH